MFRTVSLCIARRRPSGWGVLPALFVCLALANGAATSKSDLPPPSSPDIPPGKSDAPVQMTQEQIAFGELLRFDGASRVALEQIREEHARLLSERGELLAQAEEAREKGAPQKDVDALLAQANKKLEEAKGKMKEYQEKVDAVVAAYESFFKQYPKNAVARYQLGDFYDDINMPEKAAEQWRIHIKIAPNDAAAYYALGSVYSHSARQLEAIELFRKAIELDPTNAMYHFYLGVMYSTMRPQVAKKYGWDLPRVFREAQAHYRKARDLDPENYDYAAEVASAYVLAPYFEVKDWADEALEAWKHCLKMRLTPTQRAYVLRNMGRIYLHQKKDKETARTLLEASRQLEDSPSTQALLEQCR